MTKPFTVVSLFAGCGGSSLGYKWAGGDVRLAVEFDKNAAETYRLNHPGTPVYEGDIAALSGDEALRLAGLRPGELDVLDGSPPCQGFSTVGARVFDDPRNSLFREYVRLLQVFKPRALVMENVSGMVKGKMKIIFAEVLRSLKACGYRVSCRLLNAMYFLVPQSRQRVIFIGVREDLDVEPTHPKPAHSPIPMCDVLPGVVSVRSRNPLFKFKLFGAAGQAPVITKSGTDEYVVSSLSAGTTAAWQTMPRSTPELREYWSLIVDGRAQTEHPPPRKLRKEFLELAKRMLPGTNGGQYTKTGSLFSFMRSDASGPSFSIPKTVNPTSFGVHLHPVEHRCLRIEEVKRLCAFPDDFKLIGPFVSQWARLGNAVPPLFMRAIAAHVRDHILFRE